MQEIASPSLAPHRTGLLVRAAAIVLIVAGFALAVRLRAEHVQWSVDSLRDWIQQWPLAPLAFIAVMVLRPFMLVPSVLLMTAGGALFGFVGGTLLGTIGGTLSGVMLFWLSRSLGRDFIERRIGARLRQVDDYFRDRGARLVTLYTAFPATPLGIMQLACGLSAMPLAQFTVASLIGVLPRTALLAWFGDALMQRQWLSAGIAVALLVTAFLIGLWMNQRGKASSKR
jgi:uncharacterized membrane protein YdjX (TVP38/TMEM64 family)